MPDPEFTYFEDVAPNTPLPLYAGYGFFVDLFGIQPMRGPLRLGRGTRQAPALTTTGANRTGIYFPTISSIAYVIDAYLRFLVDADGVAFGNKSDHFARVQTDLLTENQTFQFPDQSGILALVVQITEDQTFENTQGAIMLPGQAVFIAGDGEIQLAQADDEATSLYVGLSEGTIADGADGLVKVGSVLTLTTTEWDAVTGETGGLTPGVIYYVSAAVAGGLTQTETPVLAGIALGTTRMKVGGLGSGGSAAVSWTDLVLADSTSATLSDLTGLRGKILIEDSEGDFCIVRITPTAILMIEGSTAYVFNASPSADQIGLHLSIPNLVVSAGSSSGRTISWRYEGP